MYNIKSLLIVVISVLCSIMDSSWAKVSLEDLVDGILYPRTVDSPGIHMAQTFIKMIFEKYNPTWTFEQDHFEQDTVIGQKHFTNLIARFRPGCPRQLVLGW